MGIRAGTGLGTTESKMMITNTGWADPNVRKRLRAAGLSLAAALAVWAVPGAPAARADEDVWPALKTDIYGTRPIVEGDGFVILDAPERAEDAAVVPITIRVPPAVNGALKSMSLIIDKNPAPVAATWTFGPAAGDGGGERRMSTRVRIDMYSYVRAVVETSDGTLHMTKAFVKASGGCSAPAPKDADAANADLGKMVVRSFDPALSTTPLREGLIMIKHPNNNGLQFDPITRGYTPARFIDDMTVRRGADLVFRMEAGISIASNPNFRFTYANSASPGLDVVATDTDKTEFRGESQQMARTQ